MLVIASLGLWPLRGADYCLDWTWLPSMSGCVRILPGTLPWSSYAMNNSNNCDNSNNSDHDNHDHNNDENHVKLCCHCNQTGGSTSIVAAIVMLHAWALKA